MRRLIWIAATGLALIGAGIAVAHEGHTNSIAPVSAGFTATTASNLHTDTCTGTNGTYTTTRGRWTGTVSGDTTNHLNGNATIDAQIVVGPTGDGTVEGKLRIDGTGGAGHTVAGFDAVIAGGGNFAGLAGGHGDGDSWNSLVANISGNWSSTGGFTGGKIGGGTSGGNAVLLSRGGCEPPKPPKPQTADAKGIVTAASSTSITVNGVTCTVPTNLSAAVVALHVNVDRVEIKCTSNGSVNTLAHLETDNQDH
jgi:hypothetical protein